MRQCVLGDRGYYENSLISLLLTMQDDFVICRELVLDMVERELCRSTEIIKIYAAKSIYLNAHDDVTQKLLELIAEQQNQLRTDMTVCCMILYKILSCDYDDQQLEIFVRILQSKLC